MESLYIWVLMLNECRPMMNVSRGIIVLPRGPLCGNDNKLTQCLRQVLREDVIAKPPPWTHTMATPNKLQN